MDKLENVVKERGLNVFARIDHAAGAAKIGKTLRPTEVLIFGNPQGGTPFMECAQSVGIDLPLKALVWQDASGAGLARLQRPGLTRRNGTACRSARSSNQCARRWRAGRGRRSHPDPRWLPLRFS